MSRRRPLRKSGSQCSIGVGAGGARYFQSCTPSFYNSEQQAIDARAARNLTYSGSLLDYIGLPGAVAPGSRLRGRHGATSGGLGRTSLGLLSDDPASGGVGHERRTGNSRMAIMMGLRMPSEMYEGSPVSSIVWVRSSSTSMSVASSRRAKLAPRQK